MPEIQFAPELLPRWRPAAPDATIEPVWAAIPRTLDYTGALLMPINLRQAPVPSDLVPSGLPGPVRIMREE
jgi:hypothetical protein